MRTVDGVAGEDGRRNGGADVRDEERNLLAVHLHVVVRDTRIGLYVPVAFEHGEGHPRDAASSRPGRVEDVRPVPPVQRGGRDQGVQAVAEGQRGHDERDGERGPEQHGADRHRSAPLAGLERHPDPHHAGRRQSSPRQGGDGAGARCRSDAGPERNAVRSRRVGQQDGHGAQQHRPGSARRSPAPSSRRRTPCDGYTGRTGPSGDSGDNATATTAASKVPTTIAASRPIRPSRMVSAGLAPSARRTRTSSDSSGAGARSAAPR